MANAGGLWQGLADEPSLSTGEAASITGRGGVVQVSSAQSSVTGFSAWSCTGGGADSPLTYRVLEGGEGPPVVLMHELIGVGPTLLVLAWTLRDAGYRVWLPIFFEPGAEDVGVVRGIVQVCIRREFRSLARSGQTPLTDWLRDLLDHAALQGASNESPETAEQVAIIGMCMTGGLVFAQLTHPRVGAAVSAQPSMPLAPDIPVLGARGARNLGLTPQESRDAAASDTPLLALRFAGDRLCASERLEAVRATFGDGGCELVDTDEVLRVEQCGRLRVVQASGSAHATLTLHAPKAQGRTVDQVLAFLEEHLPMPHGGDIHDT